MPPMCATCRWYDHIDQEEGYCRGVWTIPDDTQHILWAKTTPTARCAEWSTTQPTRLQQTITRAKHLLTK